MSEKSYFFIFEQENDAVYEKAITVAHLSEGGVAYELLEDDAKELGITSQPYLMYMWPASQKYMEDEETYYISHYSHSDGTITEVSMDILTPLPF